MIPKIIHYCWFGRKSLPSNVIKCIESWQHFCPEYEIIQWNEDNYDIQSNAYVKQAYLAGKFAFVSDYVRLDVIERFGGIYLDTDVELIKNVDSLLKYDAFFGMEEAGKVNTGLGFGALQNSFIVHKLKQQYKNIDFTVGKKNDLTTCVERSLPVFTGLGVTRHNKTQVFNSKKVIVFSSRFFCPKNMENGKTRIYLDTYSIHHYDASWKKHTLMSNEITKFKIIIRRVLDSLLGEGTYQKVKKYFG